GRICPCQPGRGEYPHGVAAGDDLRGVSAAVDWQALYRLERALADQGDAVGGGTGDPDALRPGERGTCRSRAGDGGRLHDHVAGRVDLVQVLLAAAAVGGIVGDHPDEAVTVGDIGAQPADTEALGDGAAGRVDAQQRAGEVQDPERPGARGHADRFVLLVADPQRLGDLPGGEVDAG